MPPIETTDEDRPPRVALTWEPHPREREVIADTWPSDLAVSVLEDGRLTDGASLTSVIAVIGMARHLTVPTLQPLTALRLIHLGGHGVDKLQRQTDLVALVEERQITVATASSAGPAMAEFALMSMIALARRVPVVHEALVRHGDWSEDLKQRRMDGAVGGEISGKELLVVGFGPIGRELAPRATALGMRVTVVRRQDLPEPSVHRVVPAHRIDEVLPDADHVVLCAPLTPASRLLLDARRLRSMRQGATVINLGRGELVDEHALLELVRTGHLCGAALDAWTRETTTTDGVVPGPDWAGQNLIATPHYSGWTVEARLRVFAIIGENLRRLLAGEPLLQTIDLADAPS